MNQKTYLQQPCDEDNGDENGFLASLLSAYHLNRGRQYRKSARGTNGKITTPTCVDRKYITISIN